MVVVMRSSSFCMGALIFVLALMSGTVAAQSQHDMDVAADQFSAAFDCAVIEERAHEYASIPDLTNGYDATPDAKRQQEEADRLFAYGYERAKTWVSANRAELQKNSLWANRNMSGDFLIGVFYEAAEKEIKEAIESEVPINLSNIGSGIWEPRKLAAETIFRQRNCHLIGR
jgi:hypothetical protein